jgi:branched-chain amino acid transport system substrate-binding protein
MDVQTAKALIKSSPVTTWAIQAEDYNTGHTSATEFEAAVVAAGKKVILTQFAPANTTDFGSYISTLSSSGAQGLFIVEAGADGAAFINQAAQYNLLGKFQTVLGFNTVTDPLFKTFGSKVLGFYDNIGYVPAIDNALNKTFVTNWKAANGSNPYYVEADTYLAAQVLFQAVGKAKSIDPAEVSKALGGLQFDSIVGSVTVRAEDHQLLRPSYIGQVIEDPNGTSGMGWKIVATATPEETTPAADPACQM